MTLSLRQDNLVGQDLGWDTILAGDICYERDLAQAVTDWLFALQDRGATVLVGDPGPELPADGRGCDRLAEYQVPVTRTLEDADVKKTSVWRFRPDERRRDRALGARFANLVYKPALDRWGISLQLIDGSTVLPHRIDL